MQHLEHYENARPSASSSAVLITEYLRTAYVEKFVSRQRPRERPTLEVGPAETSCSSGRDCKESRSDTPEKKSLALEDKNSSAAAQTKGQVDTAFCHEKF